MDEARTRLHHDMQHFVNEVTEEELENIINQMENCARLAEKAAWTVLKYTATALSVPSALRF